MGKCMETVFKKNSLKLNAASHNSAIWNTDTGGILVHTVREACAMRGLPSRTQFHFLKKLYFIDYATIVVPFLPLCPLHSLRQSPYHCSCPWVIRVSSLASPSPIVCFTPPWLFCNYLFVQHTEYKTLSVSRVLFLFYLFA